MQMSQCSLGISNSETHAWKDGTHKLKSDSPLRLSGKKQPSRSQKILEARSKVSEQSAPLESKHRSQRCFQGKHGAQKHKNIPQSPQTRLEKRQRRIPLAACVQLFITLMAAPTSCCESGRGALLRRMNATKPTTGTSTAQAIAATIHHLIG